MKNLFVNMKKFLRKYSLKCKNKRKLIFCINIGLLICMFALLFIHLSGTNEAATEGFILKKLYFELGELKATNKNLTLKSAEMQSIARIKEIAIEKIGMVDSGEKDYIVLNNNLDIVKK
jgi:cell division protein FtsB